jgi:predicted CDP-diglyceride synthetase/phosphatidate cytidylyltransferase
LNFLCDELLTSCQDAPHEVNMFSTWNGQMICRSAFISLKTETCHTELVSKVRTITLVIHCSLIRAKGYLWLLIYGLHELVNLQWLYLKEPMHYVLDMSSFWEMLIGVPPPTVLVFAKSFKQ